MKTYVLTLSKVFPVRHKRAGKPTNFERAFMAGQVFQVGKLHTIRANYELWATRFEEIAAGEAALSIRQWTGKPYQSKQREIARLTREDGIGLQQLSFGYLLGKFMPIIDGFYSNTSYEQIAHNDGLSYEDWQDWFTSCDKIKPLAIIHFTKFRYQTKEGGKNEGATNNR